MFFSLANNAGSRTWTYGPRWTALTAATIGRGWLGGGGLPRGRKNSYGIAKLFMQVTKLPKI